MERNNRVMSTNDSNTSGKEAGGRENLACEDKGIEMWAAEVSKTPANADGIDNPGCEDTPQVSKAIQTPAKDDGKGDPGCKDTPQFSKVSKTPAKADGIDNAGFEDRPQKSKVNRTPAPVDGIDNAAFEDRRDRPQVSEFPTSHEDDVIAKRPSSCCYSCWQCYTNVLTFIPRKVDQFFEILATSLINRPFIWMTFCLLLVAGCGAGLVRLKGESRTEKLFVPSSSQAMKDQESISKFFGTMKKNRIEEIGFYPKSGNNFMVQECLHEAKQLVKEILAIPGYEKLCVQKPSYIHQYLQFSLVSNCSVVNPLELVSNTSRALQDISNAMQRKDILMSNGKIPLQNKDSMIAKYEESKSSFTRIELIRIQFFMKNSDDKDSPVFEWEKKYIDKIQKKAKDLKCASVLLSAQRSIDDAISESTGGDIPLVSAAFSIMITFACVMLGKFTNPVRGHSILAFYGVLSTGLGILAGFGFSMLVGTPFVSIVGILPFLVLSVGIDDMFIIVDEFDKQSSESEMGENFEKDHVKRIPKAMKRIGATITMTTLTDITAFAVSIASDFPAIRYFCTFAAITFTIEFILQVTLFVVFLNFDARRIKANRRECLPFCHGEDRTCCMTRWVGEESKNLSNIVVKWYATNLMKWPFKILVLLLTSGLLAGGIYGCFHVSQEFSRSSLVKDGSYFLEYLNKVEKDFTLSIRVGLFNLGVKDYTDPKIQKEVSQAGQLAVTTGLYTSRHESWLSDYKDWSIKQGVNIASQNFTKRLPQFLSAPAYVQYFQDVKLNGNGEIEASRTHVFMTPTTKSTIQRDAMLKIRKEFKNGGVGIIPYSDGFIFFEQYASVVDEVTRNICVAAGAVLFITLPFCINPVVVLLLLFGFTSLITELIGLMYFWDVSLNSISMINLVMALGFAIDYSAHVAHSFMTSSKENTDDRVIDALSSIGASVFMGGASTFLGMVVTVFASSEIFRIFFRMMVGIVVFGLFNGLALLPVLFSIFGCMISPIQLHD